MKYLLKSGVLYNSRNIKVNSIRKQFGTNEASIVDSKDRLLVTTCACSTETLDYTSGDSRKHIYSIKDNRGRIIISGTPHYSDYSDEEKINWPVSHLPKTDRVTFEINKNEVVLRMHHNTYYSLEGENSQTILTIKHKGVIGGWDIESFTEIPEEIISAIFCLCRYLENENEFLII